MAGNIICFYVPDSWGQADISEKILPFWTIWHGFLPISFNISSGRSGWLELLLVKYEICGMMKWEPNKRNSAAQNIALPYSMEKILSYMDCKDKDNNVILTTTEAIHVRNRSKFEVRQKQKYFWWSAVPSGKTEILRKADLMQMHQSLHRHTRKGQYWLECGKMLERGQSGSGTRKAMFPNSRIDHRTILRFWQVHALQPLAYISKNNREKDILKFVDVSYQEYAEFSANGGDDFWVKAVLLYTAYIVMIFTINPRKKNRTWNADWNDQFFGMPWGWWNISERYRPTICVYWMPDQRWFSHDGNQQWISGNENQPNEEQKRLGAFARKQASRLSKLAAGVVCPKDFNCCWEVSRTHNPKPKKGAQAGEKIYKQ